MPPRFCQRCASETPVAGEKYCKACRKVVLAELWDAGFFWPIPRPRERTGEQRENIRETKRGID